MNNNQIYKRTFATIFFSVLLQSAVFAQTSAPVITTPTTNPTQKTISNGITDICFSPTGGCDQKLIDLINSATSKLDIAIYSITHQGIAEAIKTAKARGVLVRMVVDRSQSKGVSSLVSNLLNSGISLKIGNFTGIMHDKFSIVDEARLETGSYNYSENATLNNAENQIYINDSSIIKSYQANFENMFANGLAN